jgi:hypothetical protein
MVETVETLVSNYFPGLSNVVFELLLDLEPAAPQQRNETYLQDFAGKYSTCVRSWGDD